MSTTSTTVVIPNRANRFRLILSALALALAIMLVFKEIMLENNIPIYDVRRPEEWQQTGVIEGSHLLTFVDANGQVKPDFINRFTTAIDKDDPVILICHTGSRTSKLAHHLMAELDYTNVFNVDDGINRWLREKRPVTRIINPASDAYYSRGL
jgi:rhodanese-related sulfurtransferase